MQVQVIWQHLHADIAIAIQITVHTDVLVHMFARMIHEGMQLKAWRAASRRVAGAGKRRGGKENRYEHGDHQQHMESFLHNLIHLSCVWQARVEAVTPLR